MRTHHFTDRVDEVGLVVQNVHTLEALVVVGHGDVVQVQGRHSVVFEGFLGQRLGDFSASVGAEVEAQHHVSGADHTVHTLDAERLHKLVCDPLVVVRLDASNGRFMLRVHLPEQGAVGLGHSLPAFVAVHGVVPTVHCGDARLLVRQVGFQILQVGGSHLRRRVAAIGERMDDTIGHACGLRRIDQGMQVRLLAVHATPRHQPHQMQPLAGLRGLFQSVHQHGLLRKGTVGHSPVDAKQVLVHHAPCADVHVPDFAVAHLAIWKAHMLSVRPKCCVRNTCVQAVHIGRFRHFNRVVAIGLSETPTIQDDQCRFHAAKVGDASTRLRPNHAHRKTSL